MVELLFIFGRETVRKPLGRVADWCALCRAPRAFQITEILNYGTVFHFRVGEGEVDYIEKKCETCLTYTPTDPELYSEFDRQAGASLEQLIAETHPDLPTRYSDKLRLAKRAMEGALDSDERLKLVAETLMAVLPQIERRTVHMALDRRFAVGCLGTVALIGLMIVLALKNFSPDVLYVSMALVVIAATITLYFMVTERPYFVRTRLFPILADALLPVRPTLKELQIALAACEERVRFAEGYIDAEALFAAIQTHGRAPL